MSEDILINNYEKICLKSMNYDELRQYLKSIGVEPFRADQLYNRMYNGKVKSVEEITEFSKKLKKIIEDNAKLNVLSLLKCQISSDGTRKYLFKIQDGYAVESVFMQYKYGNTACISSQAGCRMACSFCASGIGGFQRNLSAGEMVDQIVSMERDTGKRIGHIVVMGTGEPFDNYENLVKFISIIHEEKGFNIGLRNITISTCGILPKIRCFAEDFPQVNLAISLHAPNQELRRKLMPIAHGYEMDDLIETCREYTKITNRRITFEYALIKGVNDDLKYGKQLIKLLRGILCHVNLIPLNQVKEKQIKGTDKKQTENFAILLINAGIETTVRRELGSDISAACGQLRLSEMEKSKLSSM